MEKKIFADLFQQYQLPLYRYLLQMSRDKQLAEELLQETFYRAMISLNVKQVSEPKPWLFRVARNLYIDTSRKKKAEMRMVEKIKMESNQVSELGLPDESLSGKMRQAHIENILSRLPERMRTVLYLREIQDFTYKEIAATTGFNESNVKTTLHRARKKFRYYDDLIQGRATDERGR